MSYDNTGTIETDSRFQPSDRTVELDTEDLSNATLDNVEVVDGVAQLVASEPVVPDSEDLLAHWDLSQESFSDGETIGTITDQTGNGHDLVATGDPTAVADGINGKMVARLDGADDYLEASLGGISQPYSIFIAARQRDTYSFQEIWRDPNATRYFADNEDTYGLYVGNTTINGSKTPDTSPHIFSQLLKSTDEVYIDGSQDISGDGGSDDLDTIRFGADADLTRYMELDFAETFVYPMDKSTIRSDAESHLNNQYAVF